MWLTLTDYWVGVATEPLEVTPCRAYVDPGERALGCFEGHGLSVWEAIQHACEHAVASPHWQDNEQVFVIEERKLHEIGHAATRLDPSTPIVLQFHAHVHISIDAEDDESDDDE